MSDLPSVPTVEIVEPIRRNLIVLGLRMFIILFIADTFYAALLLIAVFGYIPTEWNITYIAFLWIAHTVKNIIITYLLIAIVIRWISTLYYVTAGHLIRQRGVLTTVETVFQLTDIESVVFHQSWLGSIFNFGDVTITFLVARQKEEVVLYAVNNPRRYEQLFSKYV